MVVLATAKNEEIWIKNEGTRAVIFFFFFFFFFFFKN